MSSKTARTIEIGGVIAASAIETLAAALAVEGFGLEYEDPFYETSNAIIAINQAIEDNTALVIRHGGTRFGLGAIQETLTNLDLEFTCTDEDGPLIIRRDGVVSCIGGMDGEPALPLAMLLEALKTNSLASMLQSKAFMLRPVPPLHLDNGMAPATAPTVPVLTLTDAQRTLLEHYPHADLLPVAIQDGMPMGEFHEQMSHCGDGLFRFLMSELNEDAESLDEALSRTIRARRDVETIEDALLKKIEEAAVTAGDTASGGVLALFVPQTWQGDVATPVAPLGPDTFEVTDEINNAGRECDWDRDHARRDALRLAAAAPAWVRDWNGPFEVRVADAARNYWGKSSKALTEGAKEATS